MGPKLVAFVTMFVFLFDVEAGKNPACSPEKMKKLQRVMNESGAKISKMQAKLKSLVRENEGWRYRCSQQYQELNANILELSDSVDDRVANLSARQTEIQADMQNNTDNILELSVMVDDRMANLSARQTEMQADMQNNTDNIIELSDMVDDRMANLTARQTEMQADMQNNTDNILELSEMVDDRVANLSARQTEMQADMQNNTDNILELSEMVDGHMDSYGAEIETAVNQREKCQSGNKTGVHEWNPPQTWPFVVTVTFEVPFTNPPSVVIGLQLLDADAGSNTRMSSTISETATDHFNITISSWAGSILYGARFSWMACPT